MKSIQVQLMLLLVLVTATGVTTVNKPFGRGGVGVEVLQVFWEELWLHFFCPTFWLHCILYRTYTGGEAPPTTKLQNTKAPSFLTLPQFIPTFINCYKR